LIELETIQTYTDDVLKVNNEQHYIECLKELLDSFTVPLKQKADDLIILKFSSQRFSEGIAFPKELDLADFTHSQKLFNNSNKSTTDTIIPVVKQQKSINNKSMMIELADDNPTPNIDGSIHMSVNKDEWLTLSILPKKLLSQSVIPQTNKWRSMKRVYLKLGTDIDLDSKLRTILWINTNLKDVHSIRVDFIHQGINDQDFIKLLPNLFPAADKLQLLDLNLGRCSIGDESINSLSHLFKKMTALRNLSLDLSVTKITQSCFTSSLKALEPIVEKMESIRLILFKINFQYPRPEDVVYFGANIQNLVLDLSYVNPSNIDFRALLNSNFSKMLKLQVLQLNFNGSQISDKHLVPILVSIPKLKKLSVLLERTKITNNTINDLAQNTLSKAENLEEFKISLKNTKITDVAIINLLLHTPKLKSLKLLFDGHSVDDNILNTIGTKLASMKDLLDLELDLENSKSTDSAFSKLFVLLPNLKRIVLNFKNTNISDAGLSSFVNNTLKYLRVLKNFQMILSGSKVSSQSIGLLLTEMKNVKYFKLHLRDTNVSDQGVQLFVSNLKNIIKTPEEFELDLYNTKVSKKLIDQIEDYRHRMTRLGNR